MLGAAVLVPSLLVEYFGRSVTNLVMLGAVLVLWFLAGLKTARPTGADLCTCGKGRLRV